MDEPEPASNAAGEEYRCPGQRFPISRAVHLARLAGFYPICRNCEHRHDTGSLSPRKVEQLAELSDAPGSITFFHEEGVGGVYLNDLRPKDVRKVAGAFAQLLLKGGEGREAGGEGNQSFRPPPSSILQPSSVVLGGDGRALTAELVAAVCEGLRFAGSEVFDIGSTTSACLAFTVQRVGAAGGLLVGNSGTEPRAAELTFWSRGGEPISAGPLLDCIQQAYLADDVRQARAFGGIRPMAAADEYLSAMACHYHGLRPLRVVVKSSSQPWFDDLRQLARCVACEVIASRAIRQELPRQIEDDRAHFAVEVCGNGETCQVWDEQGREVDPELLLRLLVCQLNPPATIVLGEGAFWAAAEPLQRAGFLVVASGSRRANMAAAMRESGAKLGASPDGRFWYSDLGLPLPDALMTVTRLLVLLSRSDAPLSEVLDRSSRAK